MTAHRTRKWFSQAAWLIGLILEVYADEARLLRLGHFPNITHAQAIYARASGQFDQDLGVPVKWSSFNAGPTAIEAIFADAVDATFVGPGPAINGFIRSRGGKFVIISGGASGGAGLVVRKDAGIRSETDFAHKMIATPQLGNTQDVAARRWFGQHGYRLKEKGGSLTLIPLSNADQLTMFRRKEIHGAWTVEPWLACLEVDCGGQLFLEEKSLWPDGRFATTVLIMNRDFMTRHPALTRKLLAALVDVTRQINRDKTAAGRILNAELKKQTGQALSGPVMAKAIARVEFTWDPVVASVRDSAEAAHQIGFIRNQPDLNGLFSLRLLNEVLAEKKLPPVAE